MLQLILLTIIIVLTSFAYLIRKQYSFWEDFEIPSLKASIPFGNLGLLAKKQGSFGTIIYDIYRNSNHEILGIYLFFRPAILIRDPVLIKNILTSDFEYFHDRGVYVDAKRDPMSGTLFSLEGEEWKSLRTRLTPAFTSGKLKGMFDSIDGIGNNLIEFLESNVEKYSEIELRDMSTRYVADCLALIAFGQEGISCIKNPNHEFRMNAKRLASNENFLEGIRRAAAFVCPNLIKFLRIKSLPKYMRKFCIEMVTKTIQQRESNGIVKKDLMQYLIQLRNNGNTDINDWKNKSSGAKSLSYEEIAANVFVFYFAGSESSSSAIAYTLYELTQNETLMERAKNDIRETLEKHNGNVTYESIMEMKFIDLCVKETLRKYPGLPILNRECIKDYNISGMDFTIRKGTSVIISLLGVSRDEKYFPNPEKYDPDRFSDDRNDFNSDLFMPFGVGPRNCIAFRMGLLMVKVAVVKLLLNFKFEAKHIEELEFDHGTPGLMPKEGKCVAKIARII